MQLLDTTHKKIRMLVSQLDLEMWVKAITDNLILSTTSPTTILAVGRGGLIPAAMIAYHYGYRTDTYPTIQVVNISSYFNENRGKLTIHGVAPFLPEYGTGVLVADDIADSGATLGVIKEWFPAVETAVLVYKQTSSIKPDFFGHTDKAGDKYWYVFPWDVER